MPQPETRAQMIARGFMGVNEGAALAALAKSERDARLCTCDHDGDVQEGRWVALRTPAPGCPVHAEEDAQ